MTTLTLGPGQHCFYGAARFTVVTGSIEFQGAQISAGYTDRFVFPLSGLEGCMKVTEQAEVTLEEIPKENFCDFELRYLTAPAPPQDYEQIFETLFYSKAIQTPFRPEQAVQKVEEIVSGPPVKIFICGRLGKSTFSRVLANAIISRHGHCYFVDLDPGQPERTLPELMSITRLEQFTFATPEHLTNSAPDSLKIYTGETTFSKIQSYQAVLNIADACPADDFVVINSHGWCDDIGNGIQKDFVTIFRPNHVLVFTAEGTDPPQIVSDQFNIVIQPRRPPKEISKREFRELRTATYFMRGQLPVVAQQPISFRLSQIRFGFAFEGYFDFSQVPALISGSLVYMCHDDRQYKPLRKRITVVKNLIALKCLAVGIVKAIDVEHDVVYIATPDRPKDDVNLIVVSSQPVPVACFGGNPRCQVTYLAPNWLNT